MPADHSLLSLIGHLLLAWVVVIVVARGLGQLFRKLLQPAVMGEVVGGILLGPSLLGLFWPDLQAFLFPAETIPWLGWIAQAGIVVYMFLLGLELDGPTLRRQGRNTVVISLASMFFPFCLGFLLAILADATLAGPLASKTSYALFVGVAMSITAFPVLARILADTGLRRTPLGNLALACAALNDVAAWCLLALVAGLAQTKTLAGTPTLVLAAVYLAAMLGVVRPLLRRLRPGAHLVLLMLLVLSATVTDWIGLHALFGAFLLGVIVPKNAAPGVPCVQRLEVWVRLILLPVFFAYTGLRTQIGLLDSPHDWLLCVMIITVATAGKLGGASLAARWAGQRWRDAVTLGVLLNTRGLVELIVLNAGLELHLLSPKMFTLLVVMALATTLMTCPLLQLLARKAPARPRYS